MVEIKFNLNVALAIQKGEKFGLIETSDGLPARIVCTDAKGYRPVIALIMVSDGRSVFPMQYTVQGRHDVRDNVTTNVDLHLYEGGGEE